MKKALKIVGRIFLIMLVVLLLFVLGTFILHRVKTDQALELLKEKGYYNPVSVGEYSLNVAKFGNENGEHTIVGLAGLGTTKGVMVFGGNECLGICVKMLSQAINSATGIEIQMSLIFPISIVIVSASESRLVSSTISPGNVIFAKSVILLIVSGSNFPCAKSSTIRNSFCHEYDGDLQNSSYG